MYVENYNLIANLYNWISDPFTDSQISIKEKSNFFNVDNLKKHELGSYTISVDKIMTYNYIYNYLYNLQNCISKTDKSFSFSNYKNIYQLKTYVPSIEDIDLLVFLDWFMEEGILNIVDFLNSLEAKLYNYEDMYNIMRYYNYLMDSSLKSESNAIMTFLTEGSTEVFDKIENYKIEVVTVKDIVFNDCNIEPNNIFNENMSFEDMQFDEELNIMMPACNVQVSFYKMEVYI